MELNLEAQKEEFLTICRASIHREGLEDSLILGVFEAEQFCGLAEIYGYRAPIRKASGYEKTAPSGATIFAQSSFGAVSLLHAVQT